MMPHKQVLPIALCFALIAGSPARAATIDYIFSGTFDGSLGATAYIDQPFTVTLIGDTGNVTSGGGEFSNTASAANFTIGATTGSLTGLSNDVGLNPSFSSGTVIFGQTQSAAPFFVGEGLSAPALGSYDLSTAFPLTSGTVSQTPGSVYFTTAGDLTFGNISSLSFEAELSPTPLPAALPLFAAGLGMIGLLAWYRKMHGRSGA